MSWKTIAQRSVCWAWIIGMLWSRAGLCAVPPLFADSLTPGVLSSYCVTSLCEQRAQIRIQGGGYQTENQVIPATLPQIGRALSITRTEDEQRLWYVAPTPAATGMFLAAPAMQYAMAATPQVLERQQRLSAIVAVDISGQLWWLPLQQPGQLASMSVQILASLTQYQSGVLQRYYFQSPVVAKVVDGNGYRYAIALASGNILAPADPVSQDVLVVVHYDPNRDAQDWQFSDLFDATAWADPEELTQLPENRRQALERGFYIRLRAGEKALAPAQISRYRVAFTTWQPQCASDLCSTDAGTARLYVVALADGSALLDIDDDHVLTAQDREVVLGSSQPPGPLRLTVDDDGQVRACVDQQCTDPHSSSFNRLASAMLPLNGRALTLLNWSSHQVFHHEQEK